MSVMDLVCLVADSNIEQTLRPLLDERSPALGIMPPSYRLYVHPEHDPGCYHHAPDFLRAFQAQARYALVLFDREGCGQESRSREEIEEDLEQRLRKSGWEGRATALVIDPELENWVWSDSPHVAAALGWADRSPDLRSWLEAKALLETDAVKPARPKEAMEEALRTVRKPRSSAIYRQLARQVSLVRCSDPAFAKLKATLVRWLGDPGSR